MALNPAPLDFGTSASTVQSSTRNRVLRNTYLLLAISMVPTVVGAWVGLRTGFNLFGLGGFTGLIAFLAIAFGFMFAIEKFKNSAIGVGLLLGFTFFMGLMLSRLLGFVLGMGNGTALVMTAFTGTALIFGAMATVATVSKRDFSGMGRWLMIGFITVFVAAIANIWLQMPALTLTVSALFVVIFSGFILYDLQRIVNGGETNYVTATLSIYISIYNVFSNLLAILGITGGSND
ncbi:MAG: Bax inhibitor-1/YccA family protein [Lautropia sp.]